MKIDVNGVTITLTKDQLTQINEQLNKKKTIDDINSYEDACEVLERKPDYTLQSISTRYFAQHIIETIIEAVNFIDNGYKKWIADFTDRKISKYIPYWERTASGWVLAVVHDRRYLAAASSGFYYMKESSAKLIANKIIKTYNIYLD